MKTKLIFAILLLLIGISDIIYWFTYWNLNEKIALIDFTKFKKNYISTFPSFIRPLYETNPPISTVLLFIMFIISGIILLKFYKENILFKILSIIAFVLAFWELFSLM